MFRVLLFAAAVALFPGYAVDCQAFPQTKGDMNDDGAVNSLDISKFIRVITSGGSPKEIWLADINRDGYANSLDIGPFIHLITTGEY